MPESAESIPTSNSEVLSTVIMPPPVAPPPSARAAAQEAQVTVKYNAPLNKLPGHSAPGLAQKDFSVIDYLTKLTNDIDASMYTFEVHRHGPPIWRGEEIPYGVVQSDIPPLSYHELYDLLKVRCGGGVYRVKVLNGERAVVRTFSLNIPTATNPPIV